ncbi:HEAT repeat domain-containing protein [Pontiellaceae bacterium B1224]|nr:HEAT repeat domain-containing protein [Pontiellaceae bacterium B1224]
MPIPFCSLFDSNRKLIESLDEYDSEELLLELERQMNIAEDRDFKLMLASLAASRGSTAGALCLLDGMMTTDYASVLAVHSALYRTLLLLKTEQPDWIIQLVIAALADQRYVTNQDSSSNELFTVSYSSHHTISYHADETAELTNLLGHLKCTEAVPFLIQMCKDTSGARGPVMALGDIGDDRAIPILITCLTNAAKTVKHDKGTGLPDEFSRPIYALANLRAQEATLIFLEYLAFPDVIESLAFLEDQRAVTPLEELIENEGRIFEGDKEIYPYLAAQRLAEAKITLACLADDPTPQLCALIDEESFSEFQRRRVIWELGRDKDPRAIPALINAIKSDPGGVMVNQSIDVLAEFKYKVAVNGLIECFDADFEGKQDWKRAYEPEMFRENIAESLTEITGHELGPNKRKWRTWWRAHRDTFDEAAPPRRTKN